MIERLTTPGNKLRLPAFATAAIASVAVANAAPETANADANTLSASAAETAHTSGYDDTDCPRPSRLQRRGVSAACLADLMRKLDRAGYDDSRDDLAVAAYQSVANAFPVDGDIGPITARSILEGRAMHIASHNGPRGKKMIVDKSDQVAYMVNRRNKVRHIFKVSSGSERYFSERGEDGKVHRGTAHTPTGSWRIDRTFGSDYRAPLGAMPYARFFLAGWALHGGNVDYNGRDSHGCVRFDYSTMENVVAPNFNIGDRVIIRN